MAKYTAEQKANAEAKLKWYNSLTRTQQYRERRRIPSRSAKPEEWKKILKPRNRTNNKKYSAKSGAVVPGRTGTGYFVTTPTPGASSSSSIASPLTETARTVTAHSDGDHTYYVAVQSTFTDANNAEVIFNWLDPDSPNITEI